MTKSPASARYFRPKPKADGYDHVRFRAAVGGKLRSVARLLRMPSFEHADTKPWTMLVHVGGRRIVHELGEVGAVYEAALHRLSTAANGTRRHHLLEIFDAIAEWDVNEIEVACCRVLFPPR
jgi:hypothetical protein